MRTHWGGPLGRGCELRRGDRGISPLEGRARGGFRVLHLALRRRRGARDHVPRRAQAHVQRQLRRINVLDEADVRFRSGDVWSWDGSTDLLLFEIDLDTKIPGNN